MFSVACGNWNRRMLVCSLAISTVIVRIAAFIMGFELPSDYIFKPQISGEKSGEIGVTFPVGKTTK
jgi:hypothetical protein